MKAEERAEAKPRVEKPSRKALGEGLNRLNENVRTLAELSEMSIQKAMGGLLEVDGMQAKEVRTLDAEIYALQNVVEKTCVDLIALHAPVALDLRTITTSLKIVTDLDRVGRYAQDIAEIALVMEKEGEKPPKNEAKLRRMSDLTIHMLDTAIRAFSNRDAASVKDITEFDNAVDDLYDEIYKDLVSRITEEEIPADIGIRYILVARYLERIADHAVNVGNRVWYMVTGERPGKPASPPSASPA